MLFRARWLPVVFVASCTLPSTGAAADDPLVVPPAAASSELEAKSARDLLLALDQQFWHAAAKHDTETLGALFADDYLGIGVDGTRWSKPEILRQHASVRLGDPKRTTEREVIILNDRAAVLVYEAAFRMYAQDGQPLDSAHQRMLSCWVKREGRWSVKFSQVTSAARPAPGPEQNAEEALFLVDP
jgi:uncharacterized protein (TIGR02246 family)